MKTQIPKTRTSPSKQFQPIVNAYFINSATWYMQFCRNLQHSTIRKQLFHSIGRSHSGITCNNIKNSHEHCILSTKVTVAFTAWQQLLNMQISTTANPFIKVNFLSLYAFYCSENDPYLTQQKDSAIDFDKVRF